MQENGIRKVEDLDEKNLTSLQKLKTFIENVLREHPPIWGQTRVTQENLVLLDEEKNCAFDLPKNSAVILIHAPIKSANIEELPLNFGFGPNACMGQHFIHWEVMSFLATLLLKTRIKHNHKEAAWIWSSTHHIQGPYQIELEPQILA